MRQEKINTKRPEPKRNLSAVCLTLRLPPEWHRRIKIEAATRGISIQQMLEQGLEYVLTQQNTEKN